MILYEDEAIIVCRKRAGMAVQSRNIRALDLESWLKNYLLPKGQQVFVVHRLDQPVEGVMVFAKTKQAAARLGEEMRDQLMCKEYLAVVEGRFQTAQHLENDLLRDAKTNTSRVVETGTPGAKKAVLELEPLQTVGERQLVKIHLQTGRHHQIRVQLSHAGHPIVEDTKYNPEYRNRRGRFQTALCSVYLSFCHPVSGAVMEFSITPSGTAFQAFSI